MLNSAILTSHDYQINLKLNFRSSEFCCILHWLVGLLLHLRLPPPPLQMGVLWSENCQGLKDSKKEFDVLNYLHGTKANIICLQDTHWTDNDVKNFWQNWKGNFIFNCFSSNSRGFAILFKVNSEHKITGEH